MLDTPAKPFESLPRSNGIPLDLCKYMTEHIYMYSSPNVRVSFRITKPMISDVMDMFGKDVTFSNETDKTVIVNATVNEMAMEQFAKNYAPDVVVLKPKELADKVKSGFEKALMMYNKI